MNIFQNGVLNIRGNLVPCLDVENPFHGKREEELLKLLLSLIKNSFHLSECFTLGETVFRKVYYDCELSF